MTAWTDDEFTRVGDAEELEISSTRQDGTLGSPRTIWVVPQGDGLYVRSVNGPSAAWFRGTQVRREGHIQAGGVGRDVTFADADHSLDDDIDAAYRSTRPLTWRPGGGGPSPARDGLVAVARLPRARPGGGGPSPARDGLVAVARLPRGTAWWRWPVSPGRPVDIPGAREGQCDVPDTQAESCNPLHDSE